MLSGNIAPSLRPRAAARRAPAALLFVLLPCFLPWLASPARADEPQLVAPRVVEKVDAAYPPEALAAGREAVVIVEVGIARDGKVTGARVVESGGAPYFDEAALAAARKWRFEPARRGTEPIEANVRIPFRFALRRPAAPQQSPAAPQQSPAAPQHDHDHDAPQQPPAAPQQPPAATQQPPAAPPSPAGAQPPAAPQQTQQTQQPQQPPGAMPNIVAAPQQTPAEPPPATGPAPNPYQSTVRGKQLPPRLGPSDFVLESDVLTAAPHQSAGDLLSAAPGVYVSRAEGDAVAHQVFLRGFDAEHGQDIEFTVGPVPVNQPSHLHGQGYADLNFVIPEVVRTVRVTEGVVDPRQGDFAVAGSIHMDLGVAERGYHLRSTAGSFGTFRQLALWAPQGQPEETFGAVFVRRTAGFGQNRGGLSGGGIGQLTFEWPGGFHGVAHAAFYGGRAGLAGVVRREDVESGRVGFYDTYNDPLARAQSAFSSRLQAAVSLEQDIASGTRTLFAVWIMYSDFRIRANFTGYTQRSRINPTLVGFGDLIEQENHDFGFGARFLHRTRRYQPFRWLSGTVEFGLVVRGDLIGQAQNLLRAPQNETWDPRVDANIRAFDVGQYLDLDWRITKLFRLRGGVRADVLFYDIDDKLGNYPPIVRQATHLPGYRRTAIGVAVGPRVSLEFRPTRWLHFQGAYGEGYRSPQARQLEEGANAPFTKVRGAELGFHLSPFWDDALIITGAGYATFLSSDLAFDPTEGRVEYIGPTQRMGAVLHLIARPWRWALASVSATYVRATLQSPPPATVENPTPAYTPGQLLPYVPPVVVRADIAVTPTLFRLRGAPVVGRLGIGMTVLSPRPLPYGRFADPVAILDANASMSWRFVDIGLDIYNMLDSRYAATEYSFVSDWHQSDVPSRLPARHFSAGAPLMVLASLGLHF